MNNDDNDVAMQSRCVNCLTEHYALAVIDISYGGIPCPHCEHLSEQMTRSEYMEALSATRQAANPTQPRTWKTPRQRRPPV
jgi:DNA-directed RNA polymerase subunit RPC12/RpoP